jgi:hypothetical protein
MVQREEPTPALMREHIRQMEESLALINELISSTPYTPGATWVSELAMDEADADRARASAPSKACAASFVCLYNAHVRAVLERAKGAPPAGAAATPGSGVSSIQDALSAVHPTLGDDSKVETQLVDELRLVDAEYREIVRDADPDPEAIERSEQKLAELQSKLAALRARRASASPVVDAKNPTNAVVLRDAVTITSVALRLAREASSLATVVAMEATALASSKRPRILEGAPDTAELVAEMPGQARRIYDNLQSTAGQLHELASTLASFEGTAIEDGPGFRLQEGLVDDIVGVGLDSLHFDLQAGGDALFYEALATQELSESNGTTYDYTGRQTRLEYDVEPIVLASAKLSVSLDWPRWADVAKLDLGFSTNRVYKSGGELTESSLARELGANEALSEALEAGLAIANVNASVRIATFTHGTARELLVDDDSEIARAPLTFEMKQIELGYDLAPYGDPVLRQLSVGFRYFDYQLPRIVYELVNATPGEDTAAYVFSRESPPQAIRTQLFMLSFSARGDFRVNAHFVPFVKVDLAGGYGPTRYYFLIDDFALNEESNRQYLEKSGLGFAGGGALGVRWQMGGPDAVINGYLDAYWHGVAISQQLNGNDAEETIVDVGAMDLFHGPTAAFGATF